MKKLKFGYVAIIGVGMAMSTCHVSCDRGKGYFPGIDLVVEYQERQYHELILSHRHDTIKDTIYFIPVEEQYRPRFYFVPPDLIYLNASRVTLVGAHMHNFKIRLMETYPPTINLMGPETEDTTKVRFGNPYQVAYESGYIWPPIFQGEHYYIYFKDYEGGDVRIYTDYATEIYKYDFLNWITEPSP